MNALIDYLKGKKTHGTCLLILLLLVGNWAKWWIVPTEVYGALVALALMFLRSGVSNEIGGLSDTAGATALTPGINGRLTGIVLNPDGSHAGSNVSDGPGAAGKAILTLLLLSLLLPMTLGTALLCAGCGTNAPTKAAQGEQVIITTVNDGVHIIVKLINAGKLTHKQVDDFNAGYDDYYNAQQILKAVIEKANAAAPTATPADIATASAAVDKAEQSLLALVNSIVNPTK